MLHNVFVYSFCVGWN